MKPQFAVTVDEFSKLNAMPEGWTPARYREILKTLEFDGVEQVTEEELSSYAAMALQDLEPEEAAQLVLTFLLEKKLTAGQVRNLSEEMKDERQWEEHADMSCHEPIFNAQTLLHEAFPGTYPSPDIVKLTMTLRATSKDASTLLKRPLSEPLLVRILADGMADNAVLKRMFEDQLETPPFPEASQILWHYEVESLAEVESVAPSGDDERGDGCRVTIFSPRYWVGPLDDVDDFTSDAVSDPV